MKAEFIATPIPKCHICGADAMPNTHECNQHWLERQWGDELPSILPRDSKDNADKYDCEKCGAEVNEGDFISFSSGKDIWMCGTCRESVVPFSVEAEAS
jgi:predicted RNA-binding Zn-ribbon protein involved in translation (DUF1610 family)